MRNRLLPALCLALAATPAPAQTVAPQNPSQVLQPPARPSAPAAPAATPATNPPKPAPRAAVQQVAPLASPSLLGHSAPGQQAGQPASPSAGQQVATNKPPPKPAARPTPVVQPPASVHAQKVAPKPGAKPPPPLPAAVAAPVAGAAVAGAAAATAKPAAPPPAAEKPVEPSIGASGAPLPRWASLRSDEVNLRSGPGTRYPVQWVYRRRDLPVEIQREYEAWRLIADQDGVKGWVHSATLVGRRSFAVTGKDRVLRKSPSDDAAAVAVLRVGVVGRIRACEAGQNWCELQAGGYRGWLKREEFFGAAPGESIR